MFFFLFQPSVSPDPLFIGSKGLRDGILCFLLLAVIFAFKKNVMYSLPIFPQIVDDYKRHLRSGVTPPQCFYQFVKPYHVRYVSLTMYDT